jgi:diacylglycerol kinase (ATP)
MRKLIYLVNPVSGTKKKQNLRKLITETTAAQPCSFEIFDTNATGDYAWLQERIINENITDVVIAGGDGTINQVVSALQHLPVQFGIIPAGSGNGLALAAKIPKNQQHALNLVFNGHAKLTDAFMVNNRFACMLSGLGFDAQVAHDFARQKTRGLLTYTRESLKNFFKAHAWPFEITVEGFSFFTEAFFISIANSNQFGNQFTIAPGASLHDGLLDVVIVRKMSRLRLPFALLQQIRGKNKLISSIASDLLHKRIIYFQTPAISIRNTQLAPLHIDGDPAHTEEYIHAGIVKDRFNLICRN